MRNIFVLLVAFAVMLSISAQQNDSKDFTSEEVAVKTLIEHFLISIGNYDLDSLPEMFSKNANIGGASLRIGQWTRFTMTFAEFLALLKSRTNPSKYNKPVSRFTIHMDRAMFAFVKADAVLIRNGKAQSNNFDNFTLIKENGEWKILNGSYVSIPIEN
ncbi:MAG: nuclear transport factor 2 family protein [Chitinophagaceae bacterium]